MTTSIMRVLCQALSITLALAMVLIASVDDAEAKSQRIRVKRGETLGHIAERTGCSVKKIKRYNGLKSDFLKVGQVLKVPSGCRAPKQVNSHGVPSRYKIRKGDTLGSIAIHFGCRVKDIKRANRLKSDFLKVGKRLYLPKACRGPDSPAARVFQQSSLRAIERSKSAVDRYTVQPGDTIESLATHHKCPVAALMRANQLESTTLEPEQTLIIPPCVVSGGIRRSDAEIDHNVLKQLMAARDFYPPREFRAMVIEVTFDKTHEKIVEQRIFDYKGHCERVWGWNPASTVKIFSVIAALQRVCRLGFSPDAQLTFYNRKQEINATLRELVSTTLIDSNNMSYNRLTQLAGFDFLNGDFLSPVNGFANSAIMKAYEYPRWIRQGETRSLRFSPTITLQEKGREETLSAKEGLLETGCFSSACTTLRDLGEAMRRLMLQEYLDPKETFNLHPDDLALVRWSMSQPRRRGNQAVDRIKAVFKDEEIKIYNKPGYSARWFSDNVFIHAPGRRQAWIIVMAGRSGKSSLNRAARVIAEILVSGELRSVR